MSLLFFFRVMQVQLEVQQILDETSRKLAVYASASEIVTKEDDTLLLGAINLGLAKTLFTKELNEQTLAAEWIYGGTNGVSLLSSKVSGDYIDLVATYRIQLPIQLPVPYEFKIIQRSCSRKWTGYQPIEEGEEDVWVYITKTGTVYHTTKSCSYLDLSIQSVFYAGVEAYRSKSGGKYHACPLCVEVNAVTQKVYITNYGDCYHADLNCSGIKRTIYMVRLTETEGRKACSKCGSGGVGT